MVRYTWYLTTVLTTGDVVNVGIPQVIVVDVNFNAEAQKSCLRRFVCVATCTCGAIINGAEPWACKGRGFSFSLGTSCVLTGACVRHGQRADGWAGEEKAFGRIRELDMHFMHDLVGPCEEGRCELYVGRRESREEFDDLTQADR